MGGRAIKYRPEDLQAWLESRGRRFQRPEHTYQLVAARVGCEINRKEGNQKCLKKARQPSSKRAKPNFKYPDNNVAPPKQGHKPSLASADFHDPFQDMIARIEAHLLQGGRPEECFVGPIPNGLLLILDDRRLMLHPGAIESPEDLPTQLSPEMLEEYSFDHLSEVAAEKELYEGLISSADLAVWAGREKHRKSNVIRHSAVLRIGGTRARLPAVQICSAAATQGSSDRLRIEDLKPEEPSGPHLCRHEPLRERSIGLVEQLADR